MKGVSIRPFRGDSLTAKVRDQMVGLFRLLDNDEMKDYAKLGLHMTECGDFYLADIIEDDEGFIAMYEGRGVGMVSNVNADEYDNAKLLSKLVVDPIHRRKGIGRRLMEHAIRENRKHGNETMLNVSARNEAALALYKSLGFVLHSQTMVTTPAKENEEK